MSMNIIYKDIIKYLWRDLRRDIREKDGDWMMNIKREQDRRWMRKTLNLVCWKFHEIIKSLKDSMTFRSEIDLNTFLESYYSSKYCPLSTKPYHLSISYVNKVNNQTLFNKFIEGLEYLECDDISLAIFTVTELPSVINLDIGVGLGRDCVEEDQINKVLNSFKRISGSFTNVQSLKVLLNIDYEDGKKIDEFRSSFFQSNKFDKLKSLEIHDSSAMGETTMSIIEEELGFFIGINESAPYLETLTLSGFMTGDNHWVDNDLERFYDALLEYAKMNNYLHTLDTPCYLVNDAHNLIQYFLQVPSTLMNLDSSEKGPNGIPMGLMIPVKRCLDTLYIYEDEECDEFDTDILDELLESFKNVNHLIIGDDLNEFDDIVCGQTSPNLTIKIRSLDDDLIESIESNHNITNLFIKGIIEKKREVPSRGKIHNIKGQVEEFLEMIDKHPTIKNKESIKSDLMGIFNK